MAVVSRRLETGSLRRFTSIPIAIDQHRPGYVVVANRTAEHRQSLLDSG